MNEQGRCPRNPARGVVLVSALLLPVLLAVLGLGLLGLALSDSTMATNTREHTQTFYAAEAGLESAFVDLRALLATTPTPTDAQLAAIAPRPLSAPGLVFDAFQVRRVRAAPPFAYQTVIEQGGSRGLQALATDYQLIAEARGPRGGRARLAQGVRYLQVPLFQFGAFYGQGVDLEIGPSMAMTFNGRVHANSNLHVVAHDGLTLPSFVTAAGNIYRYVKSDATPTRYSNPLIEDASGTLQPLNFDHQFGPNFAAPWSAASWRGTAQSTFGPLVADSAMGIQPIIPAIPALFNNPSNPDAISHQLIERGQPSDPPALQQVKLYYQAGLRIVDGAATNSAGSPVTLPFGVVTARSFYDGREQATMSITQVDVAALRASGLAPANGILYVAQAGSHVGVRLVNGAQVPAGGFTVASENPVYIQGDYNTVNKVPAAVLGDAITVLSNNWAPNGSDGKGGWDTSSRPATSTTVNAAFGLGPSAESVVGQTNGQLENLIRLLENWNGIPLTYQGSLIALWHSQQATGAWRCCGDAGTNYYNRPNRNWGYDSLFNTNRPPGTPSGIVILKGPWRQG